MKKINTFFLGIDWKLLKKQKLTLLEEIDAMEKKNFKYYETIIEDFNGILHLIDSIQDYAVDVLGMDEKEIMLQGEDNDDDEMIQGIEECAENIFFQLTESDGFHQDDEMPSEFIEIIMADENHSKEIKARIRKQMLEDLHNIPTTFTIVNGIVNYDGDMRDDYEGIATEYCREQFKKPIVQYTGLKNADKTEIREGDTICTEGLYLGKNPILDAVSAIKEYEPMLGSPWCEIHNDHEDEGIVYIDAWSTGDDDESGKVIAKVNTITKEVLYLDARAKIDNFAQEAIKEVLDK